MSFFVTMLYIEQIICYISLRRANIGKRQLTYRLYGEKGQTMKFLEKDQEILLKFLERIRKFFDIRLAPDEIIHLTIVQIRAM